MYSIVLALAIVTAGPEIPLVTSNEAAQFDLVGIKSDTLSIKDGVISVTGKPNGYFASKASYKNYKLKFDWRYERPADLKSDAAFRGNGGLLIHIDGPDKVWPRCLEVQLMNSDAGNTFALDGKFLGSKDPAAQKEAIKPVGQWNSQVVECKNGAVTCWINGIEVSSGKGADPSQGRIGWQSEGDPFQLRNVSIETLD